MRLVGISAILLLSACGLESMPSKPASVGDIVSMQLRDDGKYEVICKSGAREIVTPPQVASNQVCLAAPSGTPGNILSMQLREDGRYDVICIDETRLVASADEILAGKVCQTIQPSKEEEETFPTPLSPWTTRFMYKQSNLRNYYIVYEQKDENYQGNNTDGIWISDGNKDDRNALIRFTSAFGQTIKRISFDLCNHLAGAKLVVFDMSGAKLLEQDVPVGSCTPSPGKYTTMAVSSTNGVSGFDLTAPTGNVEGNVGIDNIKLSF